MPPYDYSSLASYGPMAGNPFPLTQPDPVANWMPPARQVAFPYATPSPTYTPADYSLWSTNSQPGLQMTGVNAGMPPLSTMGAGVTPPGAQRSIFDSFLQQRNIDGTTSGGYGSAALGALQGIGSLYLGMQQYNLAKDSLANSKAQFERNFAANRTTTNARLEDRQRARVASNAGAYQSVGDYMDKNGVK